MTTNTETKIAFSNSDLIAVEAKNAPVQPRTLKLAAPATFYFESATKRSVNTKANEIHRGLHQVDPSRRVSTTPIMPDIELAKSSGNAYKLDPAKEDRMITSETYARFLPICHAVYAFAKKAGDKGFTRDEAQAAAEKAHGGLFKANARYARRVVTDTLRDLRLYALVEATAPKITKTTVLRHVAKLPSTVKLSKHTA